MSSSSYLQKAWGDTLENVTIDDIQLAITEVQQMDDEHGAFWVGLTTDKQNVLETWKDLTVIGVFNIDLADEIRTKAKNWSEVEKLYSLFLSGDLESVKQILKTK